MARNKQTDENFAERLMKQVLKALIMMLIFVVVLALFILPLMKDKLGSMGINLFKETVPSDDKVAIEQVEINYEYDDKEGYQHVVKGNLVNNLDKPLENVTIEIALLDSNGVEIGSAYTIVDSIQKGKSQSFQAFTLEPFSKRATGYKVKNIIYNK